MPPAVEAQSLNHWTARAVPVFNFLMNYQTVFHSTCTISCFHQQHKMESREFPGGPAVRTRRFHCHGQGSIPGQGTKVPQAAQHGQKRWNPIFHLLLSLLLIIASLVFVKCYLVVLICISLVATKVEHLFMCLLATCISYLEKCLLKSFAP